MDEQFEKVVTLFESKFNYWSINFPREHIGDRQPGQIQQHGWNIQFCFGCDDHGEYFDYYASHRMTEDQHMRLYVDGTTRSLEALFGMYGFNPEIPGDRSIKEKAYYQRNAQVSEDLNKKGFGGTTLGVTQPSKKT